MSVIKVYASGNTLFVGGKTFPINSGVGIVQSSETGTDPATGVDYDDYVIIDSPDDEQLVVAPYNQVYKEDGTTNWGASAFDTVTALRALFTDTNPDNYGDADDVADNTSQITAVKNRVAATETEILNIERALKFDKTSDDRGIYYEDDKTKTNSLLSVGSGTATIQGGEGTAITITEASPGSQSFSVAAGPSGSETSFEAVRLEGRTTANTAALNLQEGTKLSFLDAGYSSTLVTAPLTGGRSILLPDASGTVALTTDIPLSLWTQTGNNIYYNTGNVGIGTASPSYKLDIVGHSRLSSGNLFLDVNTSTSNGLYFISQYDAQIQALSLPTYNTVRLGGGNNGSVQIARHVNEVIATFNSTGAQITGDLDVTLDGQTYPSLQVGEVIKLKPSDNGTSVPNADNAAVYIDRGGSTSTDVVALNVGDKLRIKRNGGGTPTFDVDNAGFIYTQNYDMNNVSNSNPFNNGAGMGVRSSSAGSLLALLCVGGQTSVFGALNSAGSSLLIGNPNDYSSVGGQRYFAGGGQNTTFFNSGGFRVNFGHKTATDDHERSILSLGLNRITNTPSHDGNGTSITSVPNLEISTDNGDVYVTNGSTTVSCSLANETIRGHVKAGMVVYIADDLDTTFFSTNASYVKYTIASVDYANHEFELTTAYSGTTGIANAFIQDKVLRVEGFDGHEIANFYGNDVLRVNGAIEVNNPDSTGFRLPTADGNEAQILSTDGAGNVSWVDGYNLKEQVKNVSGSTLYRGTPVHVTGSTGQQSDVVAANATTNYPAHYILDEDLTANASGRAVLIGAIQDVDLTPFGDSASNYSEADTVYLGASGGFVTTKPSFPNKLQQLGVVLKVNTSGNQISGMITGMGQESPLLGDLNDVTLTNPATGQLISYNAALGWYNVDSLTNLQSISTTSLSVAGTATVNGALSASELTLTGSGTGTFSVGSLTSDLEILSTGNVRVLLDNDNNETGQSFTIQDPSNTIRFKVTDTGVVTLNDAYSFPNYDGAANQILATNGNGVLSWVTEGSSSGGGASTLNDLSDVTIGSVSNGNILVYNSTSSVWEPATPSSNVNADWDSTSGDSQILNKPTLATVATSGSYTDLSNKPTIIDELQDMAGTADDITEGQANLFLTPTERTKLASVDTGAEPNVNADWNSTTGDSQILNKPSLAAVATSGSYNDLSAKPTIPDELSDLAGSADDITEGQGNLFMTTAERSKLSGVAAGAEVNVNADWNSSTGDSQILNKPSIPTELGDLGGNADEIAEGQTNKFFTDGERTKLSGIATGAEVNVNADWNATSGDAQILNKPTIPPAAPVDSVNSQTGVVVLDADDIDDSATTHKFATSAQLTQIATNQSNITGKVSKAGDTLTGALILHTNTPSTDNEAASKKYVDDNISSAGGGDMLKSVYDQDNDGVVDNSEALNGQAGSYYLNRSNHTGTQTASTISDFDTEVSNNSSVAANTAKNSYPSADATKLAGIEAGAEVNVNADWNASSGDAQILNKPTIPTQISQLSGDADDIDDSSTTNKFTDAAGIAKLGNITVTQAVDLDTLESDVATNNAKVGITAQQASDITTNNAKNSYPSADASKLSGIEAGAQVNVNADWNSSSGDSQILNKPTIPTDIGDLSDVPATLGTAGQVLAVNSGGTALEYVDQSGGGGTASDADIQLAYKTTDQTITGTFSPITAWDGEYYDDLNNFDPTTGALTITQAGTYLLQVDVMSNCTLGSSRSESQIYLEFNGNEVPGSRRGMYNRVAGRGTTSASIVFPYNHTSGTTTLRVMVAQTGGGDTLIVDNAFFSNVTLGGAQGVQGVSGDAFDVAGETVGRTLVAGDHLKYLRSTSATAVTFTVPPQSSVAWVDNAEVVFEQAGAGQITIAAGSGVTINSSETLKSGQQYAVIGLKRVASDTWTLTGERELA